VNSKPRRSNTVFIDYTLRVELNAETQSVAVALIETIHSHHSATVGNPTQQAAIRE
jgi:hypothetical protein